MLSRIPRIRSERELPRRAQMIGFHPDGHIMEEFYNDIMRANSPARLRTEDEDGVWWTYWDLEA
jgi:hypothetical protein